MEAPHSKLWSRPTDGFTYAEELLPPGGRKRTYNTEALQPRKRGLQKEKGCWNDNFLQLVGFIWPHSSLLGGESRDGGPVSRERSLKGSEKGGGQILCPVRIWGRQDKAVNIS